jgi:hypothetical protein
MLLKFTQTKQLRLIPAILALFVVAGIFSATAWGVPAAGEGYFEGSVTIRKDQPNTSIWLNTSARLLIPQGAVNDYLQEQQLQEVEITVDMYAAMTETGDYIIDFVFGPCGIFFSPALELSLAGVYVQQYDIGLEDEDGNFVDEEIQYICDRVQKVTFFIEHFSEYYYPRR